MQAETLEELQKMSEQADQDLQNQIDAVEDISTQSDEDLQTQINGLGTQLAEALELLRLQQIQLAIANSNISDLQSRVGQLESDVAALQGDPIFALSGFLSAFATYVYMDVDLVDIDGDGSSEYLPKILIEGANLQIVNGDGPVNSTNGLGNLIVGYNIQRQLPAIPVCSVGGIFDPNVCAANNGTWAINHKSGSHNIVGGDNNAYSQYGGVVFGRSNAITAPYAVVTAGLQNIAAVHYASVSGGDDNSARGAFTSISGGSDNDAQGSSSSISGGQYNTNLGNWGSISGGQWNAVGANWASVSGGQINNAFASFSSISGGQGNFAASINCWQADTYVDTC